MKRKMVVIVILVLISVTLVSCSKSISDNKGNSEEVASLSEVSGSAKASYKEIGEEAVRKLGDISDEEKKTVRKDAIYKAIFDTEGVDLLKYIDITREEAQVMVSKNVFPKLKKIYIITKKSDVEHEDVDVHENNDQEEYSIERRYVYEGDTSLEGIDVKKAFPDAIKIEEKEATEDDNIEEARRSIASSELVKVINNKVSNILEEK